MKRDKWRKCGRILRYILFTFIAIPWVVGISSIIGGFILGFITQLIQLPPRKEDFRITTPATAFIFYGAFMTLVTTFGCFSASSANKLVMISFLLLVIGLFVVDSLLGASVFLNPDSLTIFMLTIQNSTHDYGVESAVRLGFFRTTAKDLWDHIQDRGKCCGYIGHEDWSDAPIGRNDSIPDTCCRKEYRLHSCGDKIWSRHPPGSARHSLEDVIVTEGCRSLFPTSFLDMLDPAGIFGVFIGACFIFCFVLALVILLLICLKKYHPDWGILSRQQRRLNRLSIASLGDAGGDSRRNRRNKVAPQSGKSLDRYLYKSSQVADEEADNYAPELKRKRTEGELYRGRRRSTVQSQSDMARDLELFRKRHQIMEVHTPDDFTEHANKKARFAS